MVGGCSTLPPECDAIEEICEDPASSSAAAKECFDLANTGDAAVCAARTTDCKATCAP